MGLYFSGSWCGPCRQFTPSLIEVYQDLSSKSCFEVVFLSSDRDEESFNGYFSKMPCLAIPFSDSASIKGLMDLFQVRSIPTLVILDGKGKVLSDQGVRFVRDYGADAYPFTPERMYFLKEEEEAAKKNQSLSSLLVSNSRDYLISSNGDKVTLIFSLKFRASAGSVFHNETVFSFCRFPSLISKGSLLGYISRFILANNVQSLPRNWLRFARNSRREETTTSRLSWYL